MRAWMDYGSIRANRQIKRVRQSASVISPDRNQAKLERRVDEARDAGHAASEILHAKGQFDRRARETVSAFDTSQASERSSKLCAEFTELRVNRVGRHDDELWRDLLDAKAARLLAARSHWRCSASPPHPKPCQFETHAIAVRPLRLRSFRRRPATGSGARRLAARRAADAWQSRRSRPAFQETGSGCGESLHHGGGRHQHAITDTMIRKPSRRGGAVRLIDGASDLPATSVRSPEQRVIDAHRLRGARLDEPVSSADVAATDRTADRRSVRARPGRSSS